MFAAARHTQVIHDSETLARRTFSELFPCGSDWIDGLVTLRKEYLNLVRVEKQRFKSLRMELNEWRKQVKCGTIDFDSSQEEEFKEALRALIALEIVLIEGFDNYRQKELIIAGPRVIGLVESHRQSVQMILDAWKSPEWQTSDERSVQWNKEQTRYIRGILDSCE